MIQQTISIAGHTVPIAYCYATEIAFADLAGSDINEFFPAAVESLRKEKMPDTRLVIMLILSAAVAAAQFEGKDCEITYSDLMYGASPEEMGVALGTIIGLRTKFYHLPQSDAAQAEAEAAKKGDSGGNA